MVPTIVQKAIRQQGGLVAAIEAEAAAHVAAGGYLGASWPSYVGPVSAWAPAQAINVVDLSGLQVRSQANFKRQCERESMHERISMVNAINVE